MVLGTANSVIPEHDAAGGGGSGVPMGRGGTEMGRGGEMGMKAAGNSTRRAPAKYNTSRFAFVVQVAIEGESFAPEEARSRFFSCTKGSDVHRSQRPPA